MTNDIEEVEVDDINADIANAIKEVEGKDSIQEPEEAEKEPEPVEAEPTEPVVDDIPKPPQSWGESVKEEWANIPAKAREQILKRESEIHQAYTRHDGELSLGRQIKDIVTPYMPLIQAAGSTPTQTINNLLNTVYRLQTGDEATKASIVKQIAKDYGVKIDSITDDSDYVDPTIQSLQNEIRQLREMANPQAMERRLREQMESAKVEAEIAAFASDPAHVHFNTVRPIITALISAGQAKDLKEAYDMACMANPAIRSTLEAAKAAELTAKRKQENDAKRRAAASITGSPAVPSNSKVKSPKTSVEDDIRAAFDELESKI